MKELLKAIERLGRADADREAAMRDRDAALRRARDAGATYAVIQRATGMSTPTITKALRRE